MYRYVFNILISQHTYKNSVCVSEHNFCIEFPVGNQSSLYSFSTWQDIGTFDSNTNDISGSFFATLYPLILLGPLMIATKYQISYYWKRNFSVFVREVHLLTSWIIIKLYLLIFFYYLWKKFIKNDILVLCVRWKPFIFILRFFRERIENIFDWLFPVVLQYLW